MAGIKRGSIEHFIASTTAVRDMFTNMLNFFDSHPGMTRIASNYGSGGTGFDFTGGANISGENAWAVWTMDLAADPYTFCIQWSQFATFGTAPGNPGDHPSSIGIGFQMAYDSVGTGSVWNGGTANAGADAKGSPIWAAGGGNLVVAPRANGIGGTYATEMQAFGNIMHASQPNNRVQIVADDDYIYIAHDYNDDGGYNTQMYAGPYTPVDGVTPDVPLCMVAFPNAGIPINTDIGTTGNTDTDGEGGVSAADSASTSRICRVSVNTSVLQPVNQPNNQRTPPSYDVVPLSLYLVDGEGIGTYGLLGQIELIKAAFNIPSNSIGAGKLKAFFGSITVAALKTVVDWDGATVAGSGMTRDGIQFP